MQIFLAPRSNETSYKNFLSTIENGVDYSIIEPYLEKEGKEILGKANKIFAWGTKEKKKSTWDKMKPGDIVFFYKGKEGREKEGKLMWAGKLQFKQQSEELSLALWPPKPKEEPWACVFFLTDLQPIYVPISEFSDIAGYSHNFIVQGFMCVNQEATDKILKEFGSIEQFIKKFSIKEDEIESDLENSNEITAHSEAELLLLKIGKLSGYDTYTPDRSQEAYGEKLSDYTSLKELPTRFIGKEILPLVKQIDVIWFKNDVPKFAFEIEYSTGIITGLQRLSQLRELSTRLFVISSSKNYPKFEKFINSDPYFKNKEDYRFKDYKKLEDYFNAVTSFSAIKNAFLK